MFWHPFLMTMMALAAAIAVPRPWRPSGSEGTGAGALHGGTHGVVLGGNEKTCILWRRS